MLGKNSKIILCIALIGIVFLVYQFNRETIEETGEELFTATDLEILKQFENQTIKIGYVAGYEHLLVDALVDVIEDVLSINMELVQYNSHAELENAVIQGEIDALASMFIEKENEGLYYLSKTIPSGSMVVTNIQNPLHDMSNVKNSKVGFLKGSSLYNDFARISRNNDFEAHFFESMDKALTALEHQEIEAFIMREGSEEALIPRKQLQVEFAFQSEVVQMQLATAKKEMYLFLSSLDKAIRSSNILRIYEKIQARTEEKMKLFLQAEFPFLLEMDEDIEVGMHNASYPYSYFDLHGNPQGIYIAKMELFQSLTGIQVNIRNDLKNTNFVELLDALANNDLQFLLGIRADSEREEIVEIGEKLQDNIISIKKFGNEEIDIRMADNLRIGAVSKLRLTATKAFRGNTIMEFETYDLAVEALIDGEIDILLGAESILGYYQNVQGNASLVQADVINKISNRSILGNVNNEELNKVMVEIQRFYGILHLEEQETKLSNQMMRYRNTLAQLQEQQAKFTLFVTTIFLVLVIITMYYVMQKKREENWKLQRESEIDRLTGLYNKYTYKEKCLKLIHQYPHSWGAFFFIDLDEFKAINDTYGHIAGDNALVHFGDALKKLEDDKTISFRIAGDEFGIFRMGLQNHREILQMMQEIEHSMKCEVVMEENIAITIKFSAGGSIYNADTTDFDTLLNYADFAMYQAKVKTDTLYAMELFNLETYQKYKGNNLEENAIDAVLKEKQIYAVYQPILSLHNGEVYGYEGLSRTSNTTFSNIIELIKKATVEEKIQEVDLLMMEQIIRHFKEEGKLFVNVEEKSKEAITEYIERMVQLAEEMGIPTENIILELSERNKWDPENLYVMKNLVKQHKFLLAIDDFGIGFSNFYMLLELEVDIVKIDKYFIRDIDKDKKKYSYVKSFFEFAKNNQLKIVYEGIETEGEFETLRNLGGDYGQGYYLGRPE